MTDFMPDAQTLLMVVHMVDSGRPAFLTACRAGACPIPAETTLPRYASLIVKSSGSLESAPLMATAPRSDAVKEASAPRNLAIGVRAIETIAMFVMMMATIL